MREKFATIIFKLCSYTCIESCKSMFVTTPNDSTNKVKQTNLT